MNLPEDVNGESEEHQLPDEGSEHKENTNSSKEPSTPTSEEIEHELIEHIEAKLEAVSYSGPIPPPEAIARYNEIIPDGANRIMTMAEKQQSHRIAIEEKAIRSNIIESRLGQIFGFIIALICLSLGTYLTLNNHPKVGGVLLSATIVSLTTLFVVGKRQQAKSLKQNEDVHIEDAD